MTALTLGQRKENLPAEVTRFIGRRRELTAIAAAVERHRLVTLRGAGGVGKTRLALRTAADLRGRFADGCWFVELSALHTPELLARTVAEALGLPDGAAGDAGPLLADGLAGRELLLILDTCEHLAGGCADLAALLLSAAPRVRILATSRVPLHAAGEHALLISPLEVPADDAAAGYSDAATLFADRARAAVPDFALTPRNTPAVAELCRRLDGIPLALELAAVRLPATRVEEMLAWFDGRLPLLGTARTANGRHRTLRAAFSWSFQLCTPRERRLWAELSVFPGAFRLAAAEHVCGPGAGETLHSLADKSVVRRVPPQAYSAGRSSAADPPECAGDDDRYQLLDTMREFGAKRLAAADAARLRREHRDYYLGLAEAAAAGAMGAEQAAWLSRLGAETANLRAALGYSFSEQDEAAAGLRMTRLLRSYWLMTGQFTEGRHWHGLAVATAPGSADNAWAVFGSGVLAVLQGDLGSGGPLLSAAAGLAADAADADLAAHVTDARGAVAFYSGDLQTARDCHQAAIGAFERHGFRDPAALVSYARLASVCLLTGDPDRAIALCEECLRRCAETGEQWARGGALWVRGAARLARGEHAAAIEDSLACLGIKERLGDLRTIAMSFDLLAVCLVEAGQAAGDDERAAVLHGAGEALRTLLNAPALLGPAYAVIRASAAATARDRLGAQRFAALHRHGAGLPLPAAIAVARGEALAAPPPGPADRPDRAGRPGRAERPDGGAMAALTRRELEVAALVAEGLGNRDIALRLFLSKRTVDSHVEHIFGKLGLSSRTQLAALVLAGREPG